MDLSAVSKATAKAESVLDISRYVSLAVPAVSILLSALILVLVVWPKFSETLKIRSSNLELSGKVDSLEQKASILSSLDQTELERQVVAAGQLLPSDKNLFLLVSQIERAASSSGVLLNRIETTPGLIDSNSGGQPPAETPAPKAGENASPEIAPNVEVNVAFTGGYSSFLQFLGNILAMHFMELWEIA